MKYVGVLLTVLAGIGFGLHFAHRLTARVRFLHRSERLLEALEQRLTYTGRPMAVLWTQLADGGAFGDFSLLTDTVAHLEGLPFEQAFDRAVELAVSRGDATPADGVLLREFGYGCGRTDMSGQQALLKAYREQLHMVGEEADRIARSKGQVYRMMGVAGGVALALLMV